MDDDECGQQAAGQHSAVVGDEAESSGASAGVPDDDEPDADEHEDHEGGDLDEGEPEFEFPEDFDGDEVEQENEEKNGQCGDPLGDVLDERGVLAELGDVDGDGGGVCDGGHGPVEPVQPFEIEARRLLITSATHLFDNVDGFT